jgi:hypothetical protein
MNAPLGNAILTPWSRTTPASTPRYVVDADADVTAGASHSSPQVQNLSLGGICIQTSEITEVGAPVDVVLRFSEGPEVAPARPGGVGQPPAAAGRGHPLGRSRPPRKDLLSAPPGGGARANR